MHNVDRRIDECAMKKKVYNTRRQDNILSLLINIPHSGMWQMFVDEWFNDSSNKTIDE